MEVAPSAVCCHPLLIPQQKTPVSKPGSLQAQGAVPLAEMPAWTLPDDNSGLDALLRSQVRLQPSSPQESRI
jgi:hypothetical protein